MLPNKPNPDRVETRLPIPDRRDQKPLSPQHFKMNVNAMRDFSSYEDYLWYMESLKVFLDSLEESINLLKTNPPIEVIDDIEDQINDLASKTDLPITLDEVKAKMEVSNL